MIEIKNGGVYRFVEPTVLEYWTRLGWEVVPTQDEPKKTQKKK